MAALEEAKRAGRRGEVPVGAVVVKDGAIVARGGNRTEGAFDATAHAEIVVLREAGRVLGTPRLVGCDLYVTLEPCAMCAGAIALARISRLYFGAYDRKGGAVDHGPALFGASTIHHKPEVYGGIREMEAAALLKAFFAERR